MTALYRRLSAAFGAEVPGLPGFLVLVLVVFGLTAPNFLTGANFGSIAFQLPELGLLTLAMLMPIISGFPQWMAVPGHGKVLGIPVPLILFLSCAVLWHVLLNRTRHGLSVRMIGSNIRAAAYAGIHTRRTLVLI